eukprot:5442279-Prymnesium_polylepis.1
MVSLECTSRRCATVVGPMIDGRGSRKGGPGSSSSSSSGSSSSSSPSTLCAGTSSQSSTGVTYTVVVS